MRAYVPLPPVDPRTQSQQFESPRGGMVGPAILQLAQMLYNYLVPPPPTVDSVAMGAGLAEPTFAPQPLETTAIPSLPGGLGGFSPGAFGGAYSPPADVFAADMPFQGGPLAGTPSPFESSLNVNRLTHGMYPLNGAVFAGAPEQNVLYAPVNTTNFGDVGGYTDPYNRGAYNLTINPTGQSGYNTNLGGVSLPWSGTYGNVVLVQAPNGEWQYLPVVDIGPNQTAASHGELDILNASLPGFGYTDRAHVPGEGWLFQAMNPQGPFGGPPIAYQGGPLAGAGQPNLIGR